MLALPIASAVNIVYNPSGLASPLAVVHVRLRTAAITGTPYFASDPALCIIGHPLRFLFVAHNAYEPCVRAANNIGRIANDVSIGTQALIALRMISSQQIGHSRFEAAMAYRC